MLDIAEHSMTMTMMMMIMMTQKMVAAMTVF
jgi:hypothetical protein